MKLKVIILGNAGAGKSTLARQLLEKESASCLSLDAIAFKDGSNRRPIAESISKAESFIASNESWIIEGCYADIIKPILKYCEILIFLNPGIETCVSHCHARSWEPEKFTSQKKQDENLNNLIAWVRKYETRDDEYGLRRHREIYEAFRGEKYEFNDPEEYATVSRIF